jgi:uncharacterized protein with beta-barrel porin domain
MARADCTPAAANNVTASCTGSTNNQGGGAPGTSADTNGYGTGAVTGITVTIASGAGNTVNGTDTGVTFSSGTVINNAGASITGGQRAISSSGTATVTNFGVITGAASTGIFAFSGATVTNNSGASITGSDGIIANSFVAVTNSGSITGTTGMGINGQSGATTTVTNNSGGSITGSAFGIASSGSANITNSGTITSASVGIALSGGGAVTNNSAGTISSSGGVGIRGFAGAVSVFNAGTISGNTAIQFTGAGNTLTLAPGSAITGNVLGTGSDTFQLGGTGAATFDVSQIGAAAQYRGFGTFNKIDSSAWTLTGTSTFAGPINVNGGTLSVNGNVTSATVNAGGTLAGTGTVGNTSVTGGTFAPGSTTPGSSITVAGTLGFNATSTYAVYVNPTTSSFANVSGVATLGGATVNAIFAPGSYISKQYTILNAGSISGTFGTLTNTNLPATFTDTLSYDAAHAYLNLTLSFTPPPRPNFGTGLNRNQNNVGNALVNFFNTTGGIPMVFGTLNANGLSQLSGEAGADTTQASFDATNQFMNLLLDPFNDGHLGTDGAPGSATERPPLGYAATNDRASLAYAAVTPRDRMPVKAQPFAARWSVWASGYGGSSKVSGDAAAVSRDATSRIFGAAAGADYRLSPDTFLGFALGGAGFNFSLSDGVGSGHADLFQAGLYGRHFIGNAYIAGALAYGWQDVTTERTVTVAGADKLEAEFHPQTFAARAEAGYRFATPWLGVTPYSALQVTSFHLPAYAESATSGSNQFALSNASQTTTDWRTELGARLDKPFLVADGLFTLRGRLAWAHDSNTDRPVSATFQTLPGASFTVNGAEPAADGVLVSAGAQMHWSNGFSLAGSFEGEFSGTTQSYAGKGALRYVFN